MKYCPECKEELRSRSIDGVERSACPSSRCGFVCWGNPTPVAAGLVVHEGKFILARNAQWPSGMYSLITGFIEKGESPEETIAREAQEELGIAVEQIEFIGHYAFPEFNQLLIAFVIHASGNVALGHEISEIKKLSNAELTEFDFGPLALTARIVSHALHRA